MFNIPRNYFYMGISAAIAVFLLIARGVGYSLDPLGVLACWVIAIAGLAISLLLTVFQAVNKASQNNAFSVPSADNGGTESKRAPFTLIEWLVIGAIVAVIVTAGTINISRWSAFFAQSDAEGAAFMRMSIAIHGVVEQEKFPAGDIKRMLVEMNILGQTAPWYDRITIINHGTYAELIDTNMSWMTCREVVSIWDGGQDWGADKLSITTGSDSELVHINQPRQFEACYAPKKIIFTVMPD